MKNILVGVFFIVIWWIIIYFSNNLVRLFWRIRWAEEYLWWTKQWYMLMWFISIILGFLILFGVVDLSVDNVSSIKIDE